MQCFLLDADNHQGTAATALVAALAYIKDPNDRNNNMQYLECISAALNDMALTYQPAERMAVVLRAVMVELRGESINNDFELYRSKSALVPARRGSTTEGPDVPMYKKRQTGRPRAGTRSSKKRTMSSTSTITNIDLTLKGPPHRWDAESERSDGYIMVTPRSEIAPWPSISEAGPDLAHPLATPSAGPRNAWMGAELDASDAISNLATIHFPEMNSLPEAESLTHLDFLGLGDTNGDWGGEWQPPSGVGSDLDGFPPKGTFSVGFENLIN